MHDHLGIQHHDKTTVLKKIHPHSYRRAQPAMYTSDLKCIRFFAARKTTLLFSPKGSEPYIV